MAAAKHAFQVKSADPRGVGVGQLTVSAYDRTATTLIALLFLAATIVAALSAIFFADKFAKPVVKPIAFAPVEATSPTANGGFGTDPDPPGAVDAADLSEPQLGETLDAVATVANFAPAVFADEGVAASAVRAAGKGSGVGDGRQPGPGSDGVIERVPRWERWKIRFEPKSVEEFAAWLDTFQIRVGVIGRDNKVHVASGFSSADKLQVEAVEPAKYAAWGQTVPADGPMPALTANLARRAEILQFGRIALLFYPFEVESLLWNLEKENNKTGDANKIRETVFTVARDGDGFQFKVLEVKYF